MKSQPTFDDLCRLCEQAGEPLQCIVRKNDGTYQVSLRGKDYHKAHNSFTCANGDTPTQAMQNIIAMRRTVKGSFKEPVEVDPLS